MPVSVIHRLRHRWNAAFGVYRAGDGQAAEIRARHVHSVMRLIPALLVANLVGAGLTIWSLRNPVLRHEHLAWLLALGLVCVLQLGAWRRWMRERPRQVPPQRVHRLAYGATLLAALWGTAVVSWLPGATPGQQVMLATLATAMMGGGAFAMASLPQAALAYLALLTGAAVLGLQRAAAPLPVLLIVPLYAGVLGYSTVVTARVFTGRLLSQRDAARQGQLVGLLLRDFEEHAADLLWEVGTDGRFGHVAPRLAQALGRSTRELQSQTLLQALLGHQPADGSGGPYLSLLRTALARGKPFSNLVVPVATAQGLRWWSFTGKPQTDRDARPVADAPAAADAPQALAWRGVISDVTEAREAHQRLAQLAHYDSLTGLANRNKLREHLSRALEKASTPGAPPAALMCLDVDHFKTINDTHGHAAGDAVLVAVAERLRQLLQPQDLAARLGGDEFAVVVTDASRPEVLHALARQVVLRLGQPVRFGTRELHIGVSVGVALAPEHGRGLDELLAHADLALYAAKEAGRGRHQMFTPRLGDQRRRRMAIEQGLRDALALGQLQLHWQPRVALEPWRPVAAEALLRWQHPTMGAVSPAEFIRVAEETGQIASIGAWVMRQACQEAVTLPPSTMVSVNVSAVQLAREDFGSIVREALAESGLAPERLEIEVTESLMIDAESAALAHLHGLRGLGVRVALDDFGTGYSSLAYLRRFPFDTLKIDRAFVRELMTRQDARAIVKTIVALAQTLGMHTLAEGVEEPAQLELLRQAGCEAIQGYLVARPMPVADLRQLLARWPTAGHRAAAEAAA